MIFNFLSERCQVYLLNASFFGGDSMYSNIIWVELEIMKRMHLLNYEDYDAAIQQELEKDEDERNGNL